MVRGQERTVGRADLRWRVREPPSRGARALALAENDDPAAVSSVIDAYDADELRLASDELYAGVRMANSARTKRRATWQRALGIVGKARDQIHRGSLPKQSRDDFRALEASLRGEAEQVVRIGDFAATHERARPGDQADWDVYAMSLAVGSVAARAFVDWGNDQREPGERTLFAGGNDLFQTGPVLTRGCMPERWSRTGWTSSLSTSISLGAIRSGNTSPDSMRPRTRSPTGFVLEPHECGLNQSDRAHVADAAGCRIPPKRETSLFSLEPGAVRRGRQAGAAGRRPQPPTRGRGRGRRTRGSSCDP